MSRKFSYSNDETDAVVDDVLGEVKNHVDAALKARVAPLEDTVAGLKARIQQMQTRADGRIEGTFNPSGSIDRVRGGGLGGALIADSSFGAFQRRESRRAQVSVEVKNTILGGSGNPVEPDGVLVAPQRLPGIVPGTFRALNILDLLPRGQTASSQVAYTKEDAFTNNAAERAEGASKAESALTFSLVTEPVRSIAHWIKVSREAIDDAPALASYIDTRMSNGVLQRLQTQILTGNGTTSNLSGLTRSGRHTAFTPIFDAAIDNVAYAADLVRAADLNPTAVLLNPLDAGRMLRERVSDSEGPYVLNAGFDILRNGLSVIFGLPVVTSNAVAEGTFFVVDMTQLMLFIRDNVIVEAFEQDGDNVQKNLITIRAEMRAALAVFNAGGVQYGDLTLSS